MSDNNTDKHHSTSFLVTNVKYMACGKHTAHLRMFIYQANETVCAAEVLLLANIVRDIG
jgi:hypothetical protein